MKDKPVVFELGIKILANKLDPNILNLSFLHSSGIVPSDWQLAKQPIVRAKSAQLSFTNGLNVIAQPGLITFVESLENQELVTDSSKAKAPAVARSFVEHLPVAEYQGLSVNLKSLHLLAGDLDTASRHIIDRFLQPQACSSNGYAPVSAALNLIYYLEHRQLILGINEARVQQKEPKNMLPALLFSGSFNYTLAAEPEAEKLSHLGQLIDDWHQDLAIYQQIIQAKLPSLGENLDTNLTSLETRDEPQPELANV